MTPMTVKDRAASPPPAAADRHLPTLMMLILAVTAAIVYWWLESLLTRGPQEFAYFPFMTDPLPFAVVSVLTIIGLLVAWVLFRVSIPIVVERMGD